MKIPLIHKMVIQANHNSKYKICKCGHNELVHYAERCWVDAGLDWGEDPTIECKCKKFKPKNHSQQENLSREKVDSSIDKPADTFNLSDKIEKLHNGKKYPYGYYLDAIPTYNIKEFIKRLKEEFREYRSNQYHELFMTEKDIEFLEKINKLAGDKLT